MTHLLYEVENNVAYLTMNRPEARNALSIEIRQKLFETLQALEADNNVRCMGLRGGGAAGAGVSLAALRSGSGGRGCVLYPGLFPHCLLASSPDGGASYYLPRLVGTKKAMEIALLGDRFTAAQALNMGLINRVFATDELQSEAESFGDSIMAEGVRAFSKKRPPKFTGR